MNLKKIIFFMLLSFMFISPTKAMSPVVEYQNNFYSNRIAPDKTYSGKLGYIVADGRVIFCVDPYHLIGTDYIINNDYFSNFSEEDLIYMKLIVNYVDEFVQNRNIFYYMAAQELIWERIIGDDTVFWTTGENGTGTEHDVEGFKADIFAHLEEYLKKPSFDNTIVKDNFFETIVLTDSNNVLGDYEIVSSGNDVAWIEGNKLYIKVMTKEQTEIKLVKKIGSGEPIYYYSSSNQDLTDLNSEVDIYSSIFVEANNNYSEQVNINFKDEETLNLINGEVVFTIKDKNGEVISTSTYNGLYETRLEEGEYEIEVSSVPYGYLLTEPITFEVKENLNNFKSIDVLLSKPISKLIVTSYKETSNFELYYKDELIGNYSDSFEAILDFGDYYLIDLEDNKKYEFNLSYVDSLTPIVYYYLDIYPTIEEPIEEPVLNDNKEEQNKTDIIDNKEETISDSKIEEDKTINKIINIKENDNSEDEIIKYLEDIKEEITTDIDSQDNLNKELPNTIDFIEPVKIALFGIFLLGTLAPNKK